jgi:hypothetical protein
MPQRALTERVPTGSPAHLVRLSQAAEPEEPAHGLDWFEAPWLPLPLFRITHHWTSRAAGMISGKRPGAEKPPVLIREGKAGWPSYPTVTASPWFERRRS